MTPEDVERRVGMEKLHIALGVNNELIKHVATRVVSQTEELAELKATMNSIVRDEAIHDTHHDWIESQLVSAKEWADIRHDLKKKLAGAGVLGAIGVIFSIAWYAITQFVKSGGATT